MPALHDLGTDDIFCSSCGGTTALKAQSVYITVEFVCKVAVLKKFAA